MWVAVGPCCASVLFRSAGGCVTNAVTTRLTTSASIFSIGPLTSMTVPPLAILSEGWKLEWGKELPPQVVWRARPVGAAAAVRSSMAVCMDRTDSTAPLCS